MSQQREDSTPTANGKFCVEGVRPLGFGRIYKQDIDCDAFRALKPTSKIVYMVLCTYADATTGKCRPSQTTLSLVAGVTREAANRAIKELVDAGFVRKAGQAESSSVIHYQIYIGRGV